MENRVGMDREGGGSELYCQASASEVLLLRILFGRRRCVVISGSGRSLRWVLRLRLGKEGRSGF